MSTTDTFDACCRSDRVAPGGAACLDEDPAFPGPFALLLVPPIGVVADAPRLADDQIGRGQGGVDALHALRQAAVVVQKAPAASVDGLAA